MNDHIVVFDIGRVLVDFDVALAVENLAAATGAAPASVEAALFDGAEYGEYSRGRVSAAAFHEIFVKRCGAAAALAYDAFARGWCEMFRPMFEMDALVAEVARLCPVYLCSNTDPLHYAHLVEMVPSLKLARGAVLSFEVGFEKPEREIYEALKRLVANTEGELPPGKIVFVDDRVDNILGARAAGLDGVLFEGASALRAALRERGLAVSA